MKHVVLGVLMGLLTLGGFDSGVEAKSASGVASYFGTKVRVTNMRNGKTVVVRINDRGPFIRGRVIDLSLGATRIVGMTTSGVVKVSYSVLN